LSFVFPRYELQEQPFKHYIASATSGQFQTYSSARVAEMLSLGKYF